MREVDTSETSVVWPAWCYSGETTVNEDLPQATSAPSTERHQQLQQLQHRFQQSSSNQSQSSSASSSPSSAHSAQGGHKSRGGSFSSTKRKSITPSSVSPGVGGAAGNSALTAALSASSTAALAATAAAAVTFQASPRRSTPPTTSLQLQLPENGTNGIIGRGSPTNSATTPNEDGLFTPLNNINNNNNSSASTNFNSQVAALQSLDKMLSERIYDRKKYLNSPTGSSAAVAALYEKFRNVAAASAGEVELNLIKSNNGQQSPGGSISDLSAIGANHHGGSGSASPSCGPNGSNGGSVGNLLVANGHTSGGVSEGNNNSSSNSNNQNSNGNNTSVNNNNSSSSSVGSTNNSNNNSIKSERFSPTNNDVQSTVSRSRSVTPSSFSGTPPQTMHPADVAFTSSISAVATSGLLPSPGNGSSSGGGGGGGSGSIGAAGAGLPEFQARKYSDFMRSLAAKYNNNNINAGNDQSSVKNPFLEPKMRINQPKSFIEDSLLVGSKKGSPITSTQVPNPSIMSSLFPGLPFQSAVFPPLIDMSSTQALVALARAAKESGIANLLKPEDGGLKKLSAASRSSSPPSGDGSLSAAHFPSPFSASRYLSAGLLPNHLAAAVNYPPQPGTGPEATSVPAISPLKSPSDGQLHISSGTFPLDLSSAPGGAKRIKLSSPTPSRNQDTSPAPSSTNSHPSDGELGVGGKQGGPRKCHARIEEISAWTVDNVCDFVSSIDICAEYVQNFRDQSIDGAGLPLLTEEHLINSLGMKLGPALKLKSMLAKRLGGPCPCTLCAAPPTSSIKGDTTPTNRPPSNGSIG